MRTINQDMQGTKEKLKSLKGVPFCVKVNRGRNKFETFEGAIEDVYPSIFTIRTVSGDLNTFSYADIMAKNVLFRKLP